jgi:hypothetical protein
MRGPMPLKPKREACDYCGCTLRDGRCPRGQCDREAAAHMSMLARVRAAKQVA